MLMPPRGHLQQEENPLQILELACLEGKRTWPTVLPSLGWLDARFAWEAGREVGVPGKDLTPPAKSSKAWLTLAVERVLSRSLPPPPGRPALQVMGRPANRPELWLDVFWCHWRRLLEPAPWTAPTPQSSFPLGSWLFQAFI